MRMNSTLKRAAFLLLLFTMSWFGSIKLYAQTPPTLSYKALASNAVFKGDQLLVNAGFVTQSVTSGTTEVLDAAGFTRFTAVTNQFYVHRATATSGISFAPTGNYTIEFRARIFDGSGSWRGMDFSLNDGVGKTKNSFYLSHYRLGEVTDDPTMYSFATVKEFQVIRIAVERSSKKVHFYVNGQYLATKDLIDATTGDATFFQFGKGHSTATHTIDIDYIAIDQTGAYSADPTTPVKLSDFSLSKQNIGVQVNWTTTAESNSSHFILERAVDGKKFVQLGKFQAKGPSLYSFLDRKPAKDNYYRLRQFDLDGTVEEFEPKFIRFETGTNTLTVYPNLIGTNENINVANLSEGRYQISLYDISGKRVFNQILDENGGKVSFNIGNLNSGIYMLQLNDKQQQWTSKIIVK